MRLKSNERDMGLVHLDICYVRKVKSIFIKCSNSRSIHQRLRCLKFDFDRSEKRWSCFAEPAQIQRTLLTMQKYHEIKMTENFKDQLENLVEQNQVIIPESLRIKLGLKVSYLPAK